MKGFKAFLLRGNVLDLAVAVVIGAAFTAVINSIVNGVINPVVGLFGTSSLNAYKSCLKGCSSGAVSNTGIYIMWGSVLAAVLQFVITAAVVYFCIVMPANHFMSKYIAKKKADEEALKAAELTEVKLLGEIRDLLVHQR
ncbi:large conductance mechanosensitive channel [Streptomyces sp. 846.5]|nr:large conductance mechanosensitive channel protein MscL [Streptomyces sp. 846.5]TDU04659.1 large conductance mechanosensitive channel [Streptomyces sp. 846.5]